MTERETWRELYTLQPCGKEGHLLSFIISLPAHACSICSVFTCFSLHLRLGRVVLSLVTLCKTLSGHPPRNTACSSSKGSLDEKQRHSSPWWRLQA